MSNILFVFEGERTEQSIVDNLAKYFINESGNDFITCAYCAEIYQLYREIAQDEYLDTFALLKEKKANKKILNFYERKDFAEIYMFFDYDGHSSMADDSKIKKLLHFFDEETDKGKLYLSYPMVESLKHIVSFENFVISKVKAKENIRYKEKVNQESLKEFIQIKKYTKAIWGQIIKIHVKKANFIISNAYAFPTRTISQSVLFQKQFEKYINKDSTIAVLNAFPMFILDYYGVSFVVDL